MSKLRQFVRVLQDSISPEDNAWDFYIPDLPRPQTTNSAGLVKCISVVSSPDKQHITLRFESAPANRVTKDDVFDRFILLSFADFRLQWPAMSADEAPRPATGRENGDWITRMLITGIKINGVAYHFFGHSNSQLKSRSAFMYAATKEQIATKIEAMGDFSKLKSVGKKAKRIGLLFPSAEVSLNLPPERCQDIDDVLYQDYIFTDGCGLISCHLAKLLAQRRNIVYRNCRYLPSVFQIRYRGYKGVLTLDSTLVGQISVQFRKSMRKFKDSPDHSFAVVDYSKPYAFGSLNDEVVVLLHTLGISQETLLAKQAQYLDFLRRASQGDLPAAFQFFSYLDRMDLAEKLLLEGMDAVLATLKSLVKQEYSRMINKRNEQRCHILIPKSRLLFGVCDPTAKSGSQGRLKEGECFVRITKDGDGRAQTIINTELLVTRNPCLHPGDLQKFKAVDVPEFSHLVDCIVFSTRGKRPSADLMSGGDLDGDKFFVTWDSDIIPRTMAEPAQYPGGKELITFGEVTGDSRAEYFARYTNASLGRVKNLYMKWARLGNAMSPQCQQLNRLFSQCVDGNHIRIPENLREFDKLEDPPEPRSSVAPFILDVLHESCAELVRKTANLRPEERDDPDIMDFILSRDYLAMSEFEMLQVLIRWCDRHSRDLMDSHHHINFSNLTDEQQIWLLGRLPPSKTIQSLIRNGLMQSDLIYPQEFRRFRLDHPRLRWKPVFKSSIDRMGRFLSTACRSLEVFHKKLIVLNINERLSVAIYIPQKIVRASEFAVEGSVRVFVFPHSQGPQSANYRVKPTKVSYRLYCDEAIFQLYQQQRRNTWIFLRAPKGDDSLYRAIPSHGDKRRVREQTMNKRINYECKASIALDKIGQDVQRHVGKVQAEGVQGAEIYVISNRDVASMNVLDQWLHYIDTEEVLPLFENLELDYTIPKLEALNWDELPMLTRSVCRDNNLSSLRQVQSTDEIRAILDLLKEYDEKSRLRDVFCHIISLEASSVLPINGQKIATILVNYLPDAVYLTSLFFQSQTWGNHKNAIQDDLVPLAPIIATGLVLSANELGNFIRHPLSILLRELKRLSLQSFAELVELIALTIRSPEMALDLLLEVLEPETPRLLVERPAAIRQFTSSLFGIALDHIDEAASSGKPEREPIKLALEDYKDGYTIVKSILRVDSALSGYLKVGDHVRMTVTNSPQNNPFAKPFSMDALVLDADPGVVTLRCLHTPPAYLDKCAWSITQCGSFVTSKTCFDAVMTFYTEREACCSIYASLLGLNGGEQIEFYNMDLPVVRNATLNASQNDALTAAMKHPLTLIWGPPGTGKTHTVIAILTRLLKALPKSRFLVTAPTHNAVDNMLRRYVNDIEAKKLGIMAVRVSTQLSKVASDLRSYTCDAMLGKDLSGNIPARRKAQKRIKEARLVFTTCIGASLGLLRNEEFDVVLVDEASQQTEPTTLVPLVKGCSRAILVGDHVQLRATVQKNAVLTGFDISLFERHYNMPPRKYVAKAMLDTQYRMHRTICGFSSTEFYEDRLKTAVADDSRSLPLSQFPWPKDNRMVWLECGGAEDLGRQSKANAGQVELCKRVVQLLTTASSCVPLKSPDLSNASIAILTPYTRQREALSSAMPSIEVSSIDGFQGREAEIIVFVTVRCNVSCDIGFLADMRRLNVVMTRAKCGVVIIGNKSTLTGGVGGGGDLDEGKKVWKRLIERCQNLDTNSELFRSAVAV